MLNFRTASLLFIITAGGVTALHFSTGISWWWLLPVILIYIISVIIGSARISSNFYAQVHCEGSTSEKQVAISFDDGPTSFTPAILQTLAAHRAPATFFVIGKHIPGNESILKQIAAQGHIIGNHTYSHSFFIDLHLSKGWKEELNQTSDAVYAVTGKRMQFFRPPYGVTTPHLAKAAKELNYHLIGWSIRSLDTTNDNEDIIFKRVKDQLKPGAVILFHDTSEKTNRVLNQVLQLLQAQSYTIRPLNHLLELTAYRS